MAEPMRRKVKMVLVGAEEISFEGREGGRVTKFKYTFVLPDGTFYVGYLDNDALVPFVEEGVGAYDEAVAKLFTQRGRVWEGKATWKLEPDEPTDLDD